MKNNQVEKEILSKQIEEIENQRKKFISLWLKYGFLGIHRIKEHRYFSASLYILSVVIQLYIIVNIFLNLQSFLSDYGTFLIQIVLFVIITFISSTLWIVDFFIFTTDYDDRIKTLREKELVLCLSNKKKK